MGWQLAIAFCAAACGRVSFEAVSADALGSDGGSNGDASEDAMPGPCDPPRKLCDGFEESLGSRWMSTSGISIDTTRAHRGLSSLRARTNPLSIGQDGFAVIWETSLLPQNDPMLYVRAFVQLDQMPVNNMGLVSAIQTEPFHTEVGVFVVPGAMTVYTQFEEISIETPGPPPLSTWLCLKWAIVRSQTTDGSLALTGDAGPASIQNAQTEGDTGLRELQMGVAFAGTSVNVAQPAMEVWFDDLIVSTSPISCDD